jgi:hypothetical protein
MDYVRFIETEITKHCTVDVRDTNKLTPEQFAMIRRDGLGASDMSAVLGTMDKFRTRDDVLKNKLEETWTAEEQEIGDKINVRKGVDLEPLILKKAGEQLKLQIIKPDCMYRLKNYPWITVNFDGVALDDGVLFPVEAKFTSTYADKYWGYDPAKRPEKRPYYRENQNMLEYIKDLAAYYGVPPYYLVQVMVQMMALKAPFGVLCSLRDKDWTVYDFAIEYEPRIAEEIGVESHKLWQQILKLREVRNGRNP